MSCYGAAHFLGSNAPFAGFNLTEHPHAFLTPTLQASSGEAGGAGASGKPAAAKAQGAAAAGASSGSGKRRRRGGKRSQAAKAMDTK